MSTTSDSLPFQHKFSALAARTGGALAVGAGLAAPFSAFAGVAVPPPNTLEVKGINITVDDGQSKYIDLDGDGSNDLELGLHNGSGYLKSYQKGLSLLTDGKLLLTRVGTSSAIGAGTSGIWDHTGYFFDPRFGAAWDEVGAHGYVGLRFTDLNGGATNYGWLEVTRGSLIAGQFGYQTVAGANAVTPVPEPSSLVLMACGAAGLLALRRRRQQQAAAQPAVH